MRIICSLAYHVGLILVLLGIRSAQAASAGQFNFTASQYTVNEESTFVVVSISRDGGSGGTVSAKFVTANGTATAPADYQAQSVTLTFLDGAVGPATIAIPVVNHAGAGPNTRFTVQLNTPTGGVTLGLSTATVVIVTHDSTAPTVALSAPNPNLIVPESANPMVTVSGTAADNQEVAKVQVKLNFSPFVDAPVNQQTGNTTFTTQITPAPGPNTVTVRSVDFRGNVSTTVSRSFVYKVLRTLTVSVAGPPNAGTLTAPFPGTDPTAEVGETYTIVAKPNPGFIFAGWSGGVVSPNAELRFTMTSVLALTANLAVNPLTTRAGSYQGLVNSLFPTIGANSANGLLSLKSQATGAFTGKLRIDGKTFSVTGKFTPDGVAHFGANGDTALSIVRSKQTPLLLSLQLDTIGSTDTVTGTLLAEGDFATSTLNLDRALYSSAASPTPPLLPVPQDLPGAYTAVFRPEAASDQSEGLAASKYPQGAGWATLKVSAAGGVRMTGVLADGSKITAAGPLSKTNRWACFASLYGGKGSLSGTVNFENLTATDLDGPNLLWSKPAIPGAAFYPDGWPDGITTDLFGSQYKKPSPASTTSVFKTLRATDPVNGNATAVFQDGNLTSTQSKNVNVSPAGKTTLAPASAEKFSATFQAATGAYKGAFQPPGGTHDTTFQGVVLQKTNTAPGFFFGSTEVGGSEITPKP